MQVFKMKKLIILLLIIYSATLFAQDKYSIRGKILNEEGNPAVSATVQLHSLPDSTLIDGTFSQGDGSFNIEAGKGSYYIHITFLSYKDKFTESFTLDSDKAMGEIELETSSIMTDDVEVEAERVYMQNDLDKRVFNVSKDPSSLGKNASDILDNLPSVTVDVEGNVSLRGSENVRILIDGKPSGLVTNDPEALRQMMGEMIERVEVITNPSAKHDAEGDVGIINIVLKKERKKGFNAGFQVKSGYPDNYGVSANGNYRYGFINLFGSFGIDYRKSPGEGSVVQDFYQYDMISMTKTDRDQERGGLGSNIRLGTDIYLNENNILTFAGMYQFGDRNNISELQYRDFLEDGSLYQTVDRTDEEAEEKNDVEFDLSYTRKFKGKDHELVADAKFIQDKDLEESDIIEQNLTFDQNDIEQRTSNLEFERDQIYQMDYTYPFSEDGIFETGAKAMLRKIDNDYWVKENEGGEWNYKDGFNNNFLFYENIYAAYASYGNRLSNFGWKLGMRTEYSDITTELRKTDYYNNRGYLDLFPTAHFTYKLTDAHSLQTSYSRRIDRPYFRHLMPFSNYTDSRNRFGGNPDLEPEYIDSYEAGYLLNKVKGSFLVSGYYRLGRGEISRVTYVDDNGLTRIEPRNIGNEHALGGEFNISYDPFDWWSLNTNVNIYRSYVEGNQAVDNLNSRSWTWQGRFDSKVKLPFDIEFQLKFNYRAPREMPQGRRLAVWHMDFGLKKDLLDNKMTVSLNGRDVFNTRKWRIEIDDELFEFDRHMQWHSGQLLLTISYRFKNSGKNK